MSKQAMRDETERLVKEALERKTVTVKQGQTRIETKCGKCGAPNRVSAAPGQLRVPYTCKECGEKQKTLWRQGEFEGHWKCRAKALSFTCQHRRSGMAKGTVKWFNAQKGYGFIQPQGGGGRDVFVHISAVEKAGLSSLNEGQVVEYEEVANKGKTSAENLKVQRWSFLQLLTFPFNKRLTCIEWAVAHRAALRFNNPSRHAFAGDPAEIRRALACPLL
jgi:cold shock protein